MGRAAKKGKTFSIILKSEEVLFAEVRPDVVGWFLDRFEEFEDDDGFFIIDSEAIEAVEKGLTKKEKKDREKVRLFGKLKTGVLNENDKTLLLRVP